jgi:hypothetical protein
VLILEPVLLGRFQHQIEFAEPVLLDAQVGDEIDVGAEDAERFGIDDQLRLRVPPAISGFDVVNSRRCRPVRPARAGIVPVPPAAPPAVPKVTTLTKTYTRQTDILIEISAPIQFFL